MDKEFKPWAVFKTDNGNSTVSHHRTQSEAREHVRESKSANDMFRNIETTIARTNSPLAAKLYAKVEQSASLSNPTNQRSLSESTKPSNKVMSAVGIRASAKRTLNKVDKQRQYGMEL